MWGIPVPSMVPRSGTGWGVVIRSGSGIPADALGKLGDRYFDIATGRWYLKRWVGNFSGPDSVIVPTIPIIGANSWSFEAVVWADPTGPNWSNIFAGHGWLASGFTSLRIMNAATNFQVLIDYYGFQGAKVDSNGGSKWIKVIASGTYNGATLADTVTVVGVGTKSSSVANGDRIPGSGLHLGHPAGGNQFIGRMCNVKATGSGYSLDLPMDDGAGVAVKDVGGGNYPGTVADGSPNTFWLQTWVPMDLL